MEQKHSSTELIAHIKRERLSRLQLRGLTFFNRPRRPDDERPEARRRRHVREAVFVGLLGLNRALERIVDRYPSLTQREVRAAIDELIPPSRGPTARTMFNPKLVRAAVVALEREHPEWSKRGAVEALAQALGVTSGRSARTSAASSSNPSPTSRRARISLSARGSFYPRSRPPRLAPHAGQHAQLPPQPQRHRRLRVPLYLVQQHPDRPHERGQRVAVTARRHRGRPG